MLKSNRIFLRAPEPEDLETLYQWENDVTLWQYGNTLNPLSRQALKDFIANCSVNIFETKQTRLMVVDSKTNLLLGAVDLYDFDPFHHRIGIGIIIDAPYQRKGFAKEALELIKEYCFDMLRIHQLFAHIIEKNSASIALFNACHFQQTGILTDWIQWSDGYENVVVMQCLNKKSNRD